MNNNFLLYYNMDEPKFIIVNGKKKAVRKFELYMMASCPTLLLIAKRRSGKSWVCRDILRYFKNVPCGVIIAQSEQKADEPFYSEFFPDSFIYYEFNIKILDKIFERQERIIEKSKTKAEQGIIIDPRMIFLMDDCLADKNKWAKEPQYDNLMYNGRHYKIIYILTMQTPLGISPSLRNNFDYIFLLATDNQGDIKRLYDNYAGIFNNLNEFKTIFKQLTVKHQTMVLSNVASANDDLSKKFFWYKATDTKVGTFGCDKFKRKHEQTYNPDWKKKIF
jgi:hypothetical protein